MRNLVSASSQLARASRLQVASRLLALARSTLLASVGLLVGVPPAFAANADLRITVTAIPASVSINRDGIVTYAAYRIDIANHETNVNNDVVFKGATSVLDSVVPGESSLYVETTPKAGLNPNCPVANPQAPVTAIECSIGQLRGSADPVGSKTSFVVVFKAPKSGSKIIFTSHLTYSTPGSSGSSSSTIDTPLINTPTNLFTQLTDPNLTTEVLTYVPSLGTTVCTGLNCIPLGLDTGTTKVQVPTTPLLDGTAHVVEGFGPGDVVCAGGFLCNSSELTVPGTFSNLIVTLRRNKDYIKSGLKIENARVYYVADGLQDLLENRQDLATNLCVGFNVNPQPPVGATDLPCVAFRKAYPSNYKPNPALSGVFEWVFYTQHNGKFSY